MLRTWEEYVVDRRETIASNDHLSPLQMGGNIGVQLPGVNMMGATVSTEVLCLLNMVTEEELRDDEEFEGKVGEVNEQQQSMIAIRSLL